RLGPVAIGSPHSQRRSRIQPSLGLRGMITQNPYFRWNVLIPGRGRAMMVGMRRRSTSHTVTREQYYRGQRSINPELRRRSEPRPIDLLIEADYPRVDPEEALLRALALSTWDP